jgi:hypothetical protein
MAKEAPVHLGLHAFFAVQETGILSSGDGPVDSASNSR